MDSLPREKKMETLLKRDKFVSIHIKNTYLATEVIQTKNGPFSRNHEINICFSRK